MSSVAFGALTTRREESPSGTSTTTQPPGLNSYIDILAALVPAEVLAIHSLVIATLATSNAQGATQINELSTLRWAFWLLMGLSVVLFVLGRRPVPAPPPPPAAGGQPAHGALRSLGRGWQRWEWQDWIRLAIPPAAFAGWVMLEPASAWNAVAPHMSSGMRTLVALVDAVLLAALTKALAAHADNKAAPAQQDGPVAPAQPAQSPASAGRPGAINDRLLEACQGSGQDHHQDVP